MTIRINRVYTRTGDAGQTRLVGGRQVRKDDPRVEVYGTVDELNSALGLARALAAEAARKRRGRAGRALIELDGLLETLQSRLFDLGSEIATAAGDEWEGMWRVSLDDVTELEHLIDRLNASLPPLKSFILPGGGSTAATLHIGRTVCRRAERLCLPLLDERALSPLVLAWLNRLSDLLFVMARWTAAETGEREPLWVPAPAASSLPRKTAARPRKAKTKAEAKKPTSRRPAR